MLDPSVRCHRALAEEGRSALCEELQLEGAAADTRRLYGHDHRALAVAGCRGARGARLALHPGRHGQHSALRRVGHHLKGAACGAQPRRLRASRTACSTGSASAASLAWTAAHCTLQSAAATADKVPTLALAHRWRMREERARAHKGRRDRRSRKATLWASHGCAPLRAGLRQASANCSFSRQLRRAASTSSKSRDARISMWHCRETRAAPQQPVAQAWWHRAVLLVAAGRRQGTELAACLRELMQSSVHG
jgi:hypothetical protein